MRNSRMSGVCLILFVLLFTVVAQAQEIPDVQGAKDRLLNRLSRTPQQPARTVQAHKAEAADAASGYSYSVLYSFCSDPISTSNPTLNYCADGETPAAALLQDSAGNLYGTTLNGGAGDDGGNGVDPTGTMFKVDTTGHYTVLHSFCSDATFPFYCTDGDSPEAGLIQDAAGNLYGTTIQGGAGPSPDSIPRGQGGTVFKVDTGGNETVLYTFCFVGTASFPCQDGSTPAAGLIRDAAGNLYGTTEAGGTGPNVPGGYGGTVFKVDSTGNETVLYSFCPVLVSSYLCPDGFDPVGGLIQDAAGNLYGTTYAGGANGYGAVFKVDATGHETVLYSFCPVAGCADGENPHAGLIQDAAGNLYGTTYEGGYGYGTVFKVDSTGHETVLYTFCSTSNSTTDCTDGAYPQGGLIRDAAGNLYGTTSGGGANDGGNPHGYGGTVFKVDSTGTETVLYSFCSVSTSFLYCTDGDGPAAGLIQDAAGNLYGTTSNGGANPSSPGSNIGGGTVFKLTPTGTTLQTITFPNPGPLTYGVGSVSLIAAASSGLPVSFAVTATSPSGIGILSGGTLTITGAGSVTVNATQGGNGTFAAATPVNDIITLNPAPLNVTCNNASVDYGWPIPALTETLTGVVPGDGITASCSTTASEGSPAATYPITPLLNDPNGRLANYSVTKTNGTLTISSQAASAPLVLSLSPGNETAGGAGFTLTLNGANFASNARVLWNGAVRQTAYVSSTQLTASILTADIAKEATSLVTVSNAAPNAGTSAAQPFAVMSSAPVAAIADASLAVAADGGGNHLLTLAGTDFVSGSTVTWNGVGLVTTYVSPWQITAVVTAPEYVALPALVKVVNPAGTSQGLELSPATMASIVVTPSTAGVNVSGTQQYTATITLSDNSKQDLTKFAIWRSSNSGVASVVSGLATGLTGGSTIISAAYGSLTSTANLTVTATLSSIAVTPANLSIAAGTAQQFIATGTYSDISTKALTTSVTWGSSTTGVATVSNTTGSNGLATAVATGTSTITAAMAGVTGSTVLTVTPAALISIAVTPVAPSVVAGNTQQLKATGTYSDSSSLDLTTDVTWTSSKTAVATISNAAGSNGLATAVASGTSTMTAMLGSVSGQTALTVPLTYSISGNVTLNATPLAGVVLSLASSATATTDANGNYTFSGLSNGAYTVTPAKAGYSFAPTSLPVSVSSANVSGSNFVATLVGCPAVAGVQALSIGIGATTLYAYSPDGQWLVGGGSLTGTPGTYTVTASNGAQPSNTFLMASVGPVCGVGGITAVPTTGYQAALTLQQGYGYVGSLGDGSFIRFYVTSMAAGPDISIQAEFPMTICPTGARLIFSGTAGNTGPGLTIPGSGATFNGLGFPYLPPVSTPTSNSWAFVGCKGTATVQVWGGGGAGGQSYFSVYGGNGGGGGGGGGYGAQNVAMVPGQWYIVSAGLGGATPSSGTPGGGSSFAIEAGSSILASTGGQPGTDAGSGTAVGTGGAPGGSNAVTSSPGFPGSNGQTNYNLQTLCGGYASMGPGGAGGDGGGSAGGVGGAGGCLPGAASPPGGGGAGGSQGVAPQYYGPNTPGAYGQVTIDY